MDYAVIYIMKSYLEEIVPFSMWKMYVLIELIYSFCCVSTFIIIRMMFSFTRKSVATSAELIPL